MKFANKVSLQLQFLSYVKTSISINDLMQDSTFDIGETCDLFNAHAFTGHKALP